jgi:hypothetical protein
MQYRLMAEEMRAIAEAAFHEQERESSLNAAANYERVVTTLELLKGPESQYGP